MSQFDPMAFLDATVSEALVKRPPLPVGDYTGVIGEIESRAWTGKTDPTKSGIALDVPLTIEIPADIQSQLGVAISTLQLKDSIMLDLTAQGTIDTAVGKNGRLRVYREAVNMNKPGDVFSPRKMTGQVITVRIKHEEFNGSILEKVASVSRA